jgi:hypothetical protein
VFKTQVMEKSFKTRVSEFPSHCHSGSHVWHLRASRSSTSRQDLEQNQMSPLSPQERTTTHIESSRPPQQGHTTSHPQIAHELSQQGSYGAVAWTPRHHIGEGWMGSSYHLSMPTRSTHQLFLKPQLWQSSDLIEFTQARQKVETQVTQLPMPLP